MNQRTYTLQAKITALVAMVVFIPITIIMIFSIHWVTAVVQDKVEMNVMNIAKIAAQSPNVRTALALKDPDKVIQPYISKLLESVDEDIQFIVVADMQGIRYSHPTPARIGERFVGGDHIRVVENGDTYISEATGTLGKSLRAFAPIYNMDDTEQIGFISIGTLNKDIEKAKTSAKNYLIIITLIGLSIGIAGAFLLSQNVKNTLLGLEPDQISKLYNEKSAMLDAIHEGIIAIDDNYKITLVNDSALDILKIKDNYKKNNIVGKDIRNIFPTINLPKVLEIGVAEYDKEQVIQDTIVMVNKVPIKNKGKITGVVATFRDKTNLTKLAEELTGVKQIVEALRANTHEFMNKLHVILGLIKIGDIEEAKNYILNVTDNQQQILSLVVNKIKDPTIAGLMLGKYSRAKELGINIKIDERTELQLKHKNINSNVLVTIIGNLIENALEATSKCNNKEKKVNVKIVETDNKIEIKIEDSGVGIEKSNLKNIFKKGFTTKNKSKGVGLALIKENVEILKGKIHVHSKVNKGSVFTIILPKEDYK